MTSIKYQNRQSYLDNESQNEALLQKFEELRQKLKVQTKENNNLKQQLKVLTIKCRHHEETLNSTLTNNIELKDKCASLNTQNEQLKKKIALMKQTVQGQANYFQQIQFTKHALIEMKTHSDMLAQERQKLLEISLSEKMHFEQEMAKLQSKIKSDQQYIQEIEGNYNKSKQTILRLQNQIKKMTITHEQEVFNKNWTENNFQTQHLLTTIKDLQKEVTNLKTKNKKQKQKRIILEDRIIELQEIGGFHSVKAQIFEGEIQMITQKYQKIEKKYKDAKQKAQKTCAEKLESEQNLAKTLVVYEQLSKKLKQLNIQQVNFFVQDSQNKLAFVSKMKKQIDQQLSTIHKYTSKLIDRTATPNSTKSNQGSAFQSNNSKVLQQKNNNIESRSTSKPKIQLYGSNMSFGDRQEQSQNMKIENKIRKERQEMERRIKQKILSRKLQTSAPSQQFRVRGDYIKTFIERRY